jgi:Protein of unknown function (DUF1573)
MHVSGNTFPRRRGALFTASLASAAVVAWLLLSSGLSRSSGSISPDGYRARWMPANFPISVTPDPIRLGVFAPRNTISAPLLVRNAQARPVTIERIETSCACISIIPVTLQIESNEEETVHATFEPSSIEAGFEGRLSVEIVAYLVGGKIAFRTWIQFELRQERSDGSR